MSADLERCLLKDYLITRTIPGVAAWDEEKRRGVAAASNGVVDQLNTQHGWEAYKWVGSVVTGPNTLVCHHRAESADLVREHSKLGGFPCDDVIEGSELPEGSIYLGPKDAASEQPAPEEL